jgi:hypothetical protein
MAGNVQIANGKVDVTTFDVDAIVAQAQGLPAPSQLPVLRRTLAQMELSEQARRNQKK